MAFIGEAVFDPETHVDPRPAARRWRAEAPVDEIDPLAEPSSLEPPPRPPPEPPLVPVYETEPSTLSMALALLSGAALGALIMGGVALLLF